MPPFPPRGQKPRAHRKPNTKAEKHHKTLSMLLTNLSLLCCGVMVCFDPISIQRIRCLVPPPSDEPSQNRTNNGELQMNGSRATLRHSTEIKGMLCSFY